MIISSLNVNKFCGAYCNPFINGGYYNPRNLDFTTPIKAIVDSKLQNTDDIFFLQEVFSNECIDFPNLFPKSDYTVFSNSESFEVIKSNVVAITKNNSKWQKDTSLIIDTFTNKFVKAKLKTKESELFILCIHKTHEDIGAYAKKVLENNQTDVLLGDFNDLKLSHQNYIDLVTDDMITYKPAQTTIDHIFVKKELEEKIVFNGVIETFATDHNILSFNLEL